MRGMLFVKAHAEATMQASTRNFDILGSEEECGDECLFLRNPRFVRGEQTKEEKLKKGQGLGRG